MRINKYISNSGFCSRREAERLIRAGRVTVNGESPEQNYIVTSDDVVFIDGKPLPFKKSDLSSILLLINQLGSFAQTLNQLKIILQII